MTDEFSQLAAEPAPRPRSARHEAAGDLDLRRRMNLAASGKGDMRAADFLKPVTQGFLCEIFAMDPKTAKRRLARCPSLGTAAGNRYLYDFKTACEYLLKPKMDMETFIKTLNAADLPAAINKVFWEAMRVKNKTLLETGEAWPTERVLDVFGTVFMLIKDRIPLITEEMRDHGLSDAQSGKLTELTDQFQRDLHEALVELPKKQQTPSRRADIEEIVEGLQDESAGGDEGAE